MTQDICWEATHRSLNLSNKICLGRGSDGQHYGFICVRIFSMLSLTRGYPELMLIDWESIAVSRSQTKQPGLSGYSVLRLKSLNTVLDTKDRQSSNTKPSKLAWRIGTVRNHKLLRQSFTKSVTHLKEFRFLSFVCYWIAVVNLPRRASVASLSLTVCSIRLEPLLFRHAHDACSRSPLAESWYSISRMPEGNQSQSPGFTAVVL